MKLNREQEQVFQKAAFICSKGEKCSGEMLKKLLDWGLDEDGAAFVLKKLTEEKYIDDERYARSYVRDKFRFNKWGRVKIGYQLRMNRINAEIIDAALDEIDEEAYLETLADLLSAKNRSTKAVSHFDRKAKLLRFAQSRGFETELIYAALEKLL